MNIWDKQQQNWIKEILSKSGTELKEISDKNGKLRSSLCVCKKSKTLPVILKCLLLALTKKTKKNGKEEKNSRKNIFSSFS